MTNEVQEVTLSRPAWGEQLLSLQVFPGRKEGERMVQVAVDLCSVAIAVGIFVAAICYGKAQREEQTARLDAERRRIRAALALAELERRLQYYAELHRRTGGYRLVVFRIRRQILIQRRKGQ